MEDYLCRQLKGGGMEIFMAKWIEQTELAPEQYSDGEIENQIYEYVKQQKDIHDVLVQDMKYPLLYHLSELRENILNWYPFRENAVILEVGAGCGALTRLLCQKAKKVVAVDISKRRAAINYERHKQYENLDVVVGNVNRMEMEEKFDYIVLNGVLEYAAMFTEGSTPYETFLKRLTNYLKEDGTFLIAIENRLGVKYFAGSPEDHTNEYFIGLNGYKNCAVKTFSHKEIEQLLQECGMPFLQFYYPYPDYKFPEEIFTKESIQEYGKRELFYFEENHFQLFDIKTVCEALIREGVMEQFANSFLIEASFLPKKEKEQVLYVKLNQDRKPEYRIATSIRKDAEGTKYAVKTALHTKAIPHIQKMRHANETVWNAKQTIPTFSIDNTISEKRNVSDEDEKSHLIHYGANDAKEKERNRHSKFGFTYLEGTLEANACAIRYPYIEKDNLETELKHIVHNTQLCKEEKQVQLLANIDLFVNACKADAICKDITNVMTQEFQAVFGSECYELNTKTCLCMCPANIDLIFTNIYKHDSSFLVIDPEWVFDFPIPVDFIVWRALHELFVANPKLEELISSNVVLERYGLLDKKNGELFLKWERYFIEHYVQADKRKKWYQPALSYDFYSEVKQVLEQRMIMECYYSYGDGFKEEQKLVSEVRITDQHFLVEFDIKDIQATEFRFDPAVCACSCCLQNVETNIGTTKVCVNDIAKAISKKVPFGEWYSFEGNDPQYFLYLSEEKADKLRIEGKVVLFQKAEQNQELPAKFVKKKQTKVDIIIPIYNAFESLQLCIESIQKYTDFRQHRVILINDCSSDSRMKPYLDSLDSEQFIVIHNETNKGFSANVNIGMQYSDAHDVILLNSDTIVTKRWVEKMITCAYAAKETGTVTPLSNSATLASVPIAFIDNPLPDGMSVDEFAQLIEHSSFCDYPQVTVAVGFCMYIKREVIQKIGFFDAETFAKGYGEENDFCHRAEIYGYRHVLCDNTFIYHEGTQSFQTEEKERLKQEHREILEQRYPKQMRANDLFCAENPQQYLRDNIKLHLAFENKKKNILYVSHFDFREDAQNHCGGTQFHVKDLKEGFCKEYNVFVVARDEEDLLLTAYIKEQSYTFRFSIGKVSPFFSFTNQTLKETFSMILSACRIDLVHVHHVMGLSFDIFDVAKEMQIPLFVTLHDYYYVCPNYTLLNEKNQFCAGSCSKEEKIQCLQQKLYVANAEDYVAEWRKEASRVLALCDTIFVPSESTKKMYSKVYPHLCQKITVIEHGFEKQNDVVERLLFRQPLAFTAKGVQKRNITKQKSICEANLRWIFARYWNGVNSNSKSLRDRRNSNNKSLRDGVNRNSKSSERKKHIAFIGGLNFEKGSKKAYDLIVADTEEVYQWYIFGPIDQAEPLFHLEKNNVAKVGVYKREELSQLLAAYEIDLICIFSVVSETFCYTLSEAYSNQIPVLAVDMGAVGERIKKLQCGWLVSPHSTKEEVLETLHFITENTREYNKIKETIMAGTHKTITEMLEEYRTFYAKGKKTPILYEKYDAKAFFAAYQQQEIKVVQAMEYKKRAEELQNELQRIENSFWYKITKNLYLIEFPGKQKLRNFVYRIWRR